MVDVWKQLQSGEASSIPVTCGQFVLPDRSWPPIGLCYDPHIAPGGDAKKARTWRSKETTVQFHIVYADPTLH